MKPSTGLETDLRKVTTINLNNNAYQIDEEGYEALRDYLSGAERNLEGNPDRAEILADLEQAIGDKCRACLGPHKTVVSTDEVRRILEEMGPVESPAPGTATGASGTTAESGAAPGAGAAYGTPFPRRMYRLSEGRMLGGVCTGLAAYFGIDVVWMRVLFIVLTVFTSGIWILIYIAMCFIVPVAETAEERAAAHGAPFNAHELINRVKKNSSEFGYRGRHVYRGASWWKARSIAPAPAAAPAPSPGYAARITGGILLPILTILSALWFAALMIAGVAFWTLHGNFAFPPHGPHDWSSGPPQWLIIVALVVIWSLIAIPLGAGRRAALYYANGGRSHGWADAWSALLWIGIVVVMSVVVWQFMPGVQEALRGLLLSSHGTTYT